MESRGVLFLIFGWMGLVIVMVIITHELKCPRCGKRFYVKGLSFWQMATKCIHCGTPKYADVNADRTEVHQ